MRADQIRTRFAAVALTLAAVVGGVLVPTAAQAATFTLTQTRTASGQAAADAASTCPTQGMPTAADHCPGYDTSLAGTDQVIRTLDSGTVRFDFASSGADSGVVLTSVLPDQGGRPVGLWNALPAACATGSSISADRATLTCLIADPTSAQDFSVSAQFQVNTSISDGTTFAPTTALTSDTSASVPADGNATFTVSNAPRYDVDLTTVAWYNTLTPPSSYNAPDGTPGIAVPISVAMRIGTGGYEGLDGPVTYRVDISDFPAGSRLLAWGGYGNGCGSQFRDSSVTNPGYTPVHPGISNQVSPATDGVFDCTQAAPGDPVDVSWTNPPAVVANSAIPVNQWLVVWVPTAALDPGTSRYTFRVTDFDPTGVDGHSNFGDGTEPTGNNARQSSAIVNEDARTVTKTVVRDQDPWASLAGASTGSANRGGVFQTNATFTNTGTVSQTGLQICDRFDSTVMHLTDFGQAPPGGSTLPSGTFAALATRGSPTDSVDPPPFRPATGYDGTSNVGVDPGAYTVEFAAGDFETGTPTPAPQSADAIAAGGCGDAATATGWVTDPEDPAITAYAASKGLTDPFDVINRVRVTLTEPLDPGQVVATKFRFTVGQQFRDATTGAGRTIPATTALRDAATYDYDQYQDAPFSDSRAAQIPVAGRIGVAVHADVSADPINVQAGSPGFDTTTYTITPRVVNGEDTSGSAIVRVVHWLSPDMRYVSGSASTEPDAVLPQADGSTLLVWDLGAVATDPDTTVTLDQITFRARADAFAAQGPDYGGVLAQALAPDGTAIDTRPASLCTTTPISIPPTDDVSATVDDAMVSYSRFATPADCQTLRYGQTTVTIGSAAVSLAASKTALAPQIQVGDDDGVAGAAVGWTLPYENRTANTFPGVDIVDVLPFVGDDRTPASDFSGTLRLSTITTDDTLSTTPNALPENATGPFPPRDGTTFWYTAAAPSSIAADPYDASNLSGGTTTWCLATDFGTAGCPATIADATGVRVISGALATGAQHTLRLGFATDGNSAGDVYTNAAGARAISLTSPVTIQGDAISVVASSISGLLWDDANGDGVVQDGEQTRIPGATVDLTGTDDRGDQVTRSTTTDADGTYTFADLRPGTYTITPDQESVRAVDPSYAVTSDPEHGTTDPTGSATVTLPEGADLSGQDFGFATQSLSGAVFGDADDDGAQDPGEDGVAGAAVHLRGTDDLGATVDRTETTGADGTYTFDGIRPGTYTVTVDPVAGLLTGIATPGSVGGTAGAVGSGEVSDVTIEAATNATGYLFGELEPSIVSGSVYVDADGDGTRAAGDPGIEGVELTLTGTDSTGPLTRTVRTLADGTFAVADLRAGTYTLTETQPAGYLDGTVSTGDSVGDAGTNEVTGIVVGGAGPTDSYTFGELTPASLSGTVYEDADGDGSQSAGEQGIPGATVTLSGTDDRGDDVTTPITSDADGAFTFTDLRPGTYTLTQTLPDGYLDGKERAGSAGGTVDDTVPGSRTIADVTIAPGATATGYLFGDVRPASLAGSVYEDANGNGVRDAGEDGIPDVTLTLTGTDDFGRAVDETTTTVGGGTYTFAGLRPGTYTVTETQPDAYLDGQVTAGTVGGRVGTNEVSAIVLRSGIDATGYTFGERTISSISGTVFADDDGDGVQGAGEDGIAGVVVTLLDAAGDPTGATATTNAAGAWRFSGLVPGTYGVREAQPDGYFDGPVVVGTGGGTAGTNEVTGIAVDGDETGYAFTEFPPSTIRGAVWHDSDDDGVRDPGEDGITGVTVTLGGDDDRTVTTGDDGTFAFADLPAGTYTLTETAPDGFAEGRAVVGSAGGAAASPTSITGIVVTADTDNTGYGFTGRTPAVTLSTAVQTVPTPTAPGPYVTVDGDVAWTYTVGNPGETTLTGIGVASTVNGQVTCPATELAPEETMDCTATSTADAGQQSDTAEVDALVAPSGTARAIEAVSSTSTAYYFGASSSIATTVTVNGQDASTTPGPTFPAGTETTLAVTVTNTGNVPVTVGSVRVPDAGALVCDGPTVLAPGSSVTCSVTWTPAVDGYADAVSVEASGPDLTAADGSTSADPLTASGTAYFVIAATTGGGGTGGGGTGAGGGTGGGLPPALAFTGGSIGAMLLVAGLLIGLGLVRRRRSVVDAGGSDAVD